MDNCAIDCIEKYGNSVYQPTCSFVQAQCHQNFLQFIQGYFCGIHSSFLLFIILGIIAFFILYVALNVLTEHSLAPTVQNFIDRFQISHTLAGVTFLAFANGAPDVLTAIIAGGSSSGSTALIPFGSIFGAVLFSSAFIFSALIFVSPGQRIKVNKNQILVPLGFYVTGMLFIIIVSIGYKKMNIYLASVLVVLYIAYISFVLKTQKKRRKQHIQQSSNDNDVLSSDPSLYFKKKLNSTQIQVEQQKGQESQGKQMQKQQIQQNNFYLLLQKVKEFFKMFFSWLIPPRSNTQLNTTKNIISLVLSPFVMGLSQNIKAIFVDTLFDIPIIVFISMPALLLIIYIALISIYKSQKEISSSFFSIYSFFITICWVTIVCSTLINLMELIQLLTNINSVYLGLTLLAWANSIADYLSLPMFAKRGKGATAISGIFSGQLFNFLIGFGLSMVIQSIDGEYQFDLFNLSGSTFEIMSDLMVVLVICSCLIYFSFLSFTVVKLKGQLNKKQGVLFRYYYGAFIIISSIIAISTDFFREFNCAM